MKRIYDPNCPERAMFLVNSEALREQYAPLPGDTFSRMAAGHQGWDARGPARVAALAEYFSGYHTDDAPHVDTRFRRWWHAPVEKVLRWLRLL